MSPALPTDIELLDAAAVTYDPHADPYFEDEEHAIRVFLTRRAYDNLPIFAIEGTHDFLGWSLVDFVALMVRDQQGIDHKTLGLVHAGFYEAAILSLARILLIAQKEPYGITGHSLGAALALMLAGLLIDLGLPPLRVGAFAPPRVGTIDFLKVVTSVPFCAYRFGNDPVTQVPFTVPGFPFAQVPLIRVGAPRLLFWRCHHFPNYDDAVKDTAGRK